MLEGKGKTYRKRSLLLKVQKGLQSLSIRKTSSASKKSKKGENFEGKEDDK